MENGRVADVARGGNPFWQAGSARELPEPHSSRRLLRKQLHPGEGRWGSALEPAIGRRSSAGLGSPVRAAGPEPPEGQRGARLPPPWLPALPPFPWVCLFFQLFQPNDRAFPSPRSGGEGSGILCQSSSEGVSFFFFFLPFCINLL